MKPSTHGWAIFTQAAREEYLTPAYDPVTAKEGQGGESLALSWLDEYLADGASLLLSSSGRRPAKAPLHVVSN